MELTTPQAPLFFLFSCTTALPRAWKRNIQLKQWITSALFRFLLGNFKPRHIQALSPTTSETYTEWVKAMQLQQAAKGSPQEALKSRIVPLQVEPAASILWVGNPDRATKFVLFFHGGGYVAPLTPGHLNWCWHAYVREQHKEGTNGSLKEHKVAVAILQYSLAPEAKYPTQLRQAIAALDHILGQGIAPRDLIVGGDSAGGNLAVQLLHHLSHPKPGLQLLKGDALRFAGVFLVSPWVSGHTDTVSFRENGLVDMLCASIVSQSEKHVLGDINETDRLKAHPALPLDSDLPWLGNIKHFTESIYITCGHEEVFRDHVLSFSEAVRRWNPDLEVKLEVGLGEVHDCILLEGVHGVFGDATQRMQAWAASRLQR
ncbi:hypothetical protein N8I77_005067 [Diaporthe amygdali]|uniref:Alpha/beta hydrolase fold-3 domain-containing protein n=1 Tax=Phomopsis amygdali TaxID=1214568 RepID=A0AAD9SM84_PHOAM|nr:hypothetical protein N8I77_005067 [Diaporthe amygdali]